MNVNDLLIELEKRDTLLANDAASTIRYLIKERDRAFDKGVLWAKTEATYKKPAKDTEHDRQQ